jgi:hypothetical protein
VVIALCEDGEHEWSGLDAMTDECLRCGKVEEHEPTYGDVSMGEDA